MLIDLRRQIVGVNVIHRLISILHTTVNSMIPMGLERVGP